MKDPGLLLVEMLTWLLPKKPEPLCVVECGTIRQATFEGHEDGLATYHIARWMARHRGGRHAFYSFELTAGHLKACQSFLHADGLDDYVTFGLGDADPLLEHFCQPIDVCYLDAGADPVANLSQYRRAEKWLRAPGMVVIDDVFDPRNADRGLVTVPYARLEGHKVACIDGRLALISFGVDDYPLPANSYWLEGTQVTEPRLVEVRAERDAAYGYLSRLFAHAAPQCEPFPDLMGLCTQIDNLLAGYRIDRDKATAKVRECETAWQEREAAIATTQQKLSESVIARAALETERDALALDVRDLSRMVQTLEEGRTAFFKDIYTPEREATLRALRNIRTSAARGRATTHKDKQFDHILRFCAEQGVVSEVLRAPGGTEDA